MLVKTKYAGLCVLGTEIFYVLCVGYGADQPAEPWIYTAALSN